MQIKNRMNLNLLIKLTRNTNRHKQQIKPGSQSSTNSPTIQTIQSTMGSLNFGKFKSKDDHISNCRSNDFIITNNKNQCGNQ